MASTTVHTGPQIVPCHQQQSHQEPAMIHQEYPSTDENVDCSNREEGVWDDKDGVEPLCSCQDDGPIDVSDNKNEREAKTCKRKEGSIFFSAFNC
jgi:hypothetical protein